LKDGEEALKKKFADLDKQRAVLSPEAFSKRQEEVLAERDKFREQVDTFQGDLRKKEQEYTQDILEEVQAIIKDMAEKEGFALVLEKSEAGVLYAPEKFDLTERALQAYDAKKAAGAAAKKK
jgi:outer membrane protein